MAQVVNNVKGRIQGLESVFLDMRRDPSAENAAYSIRALRQDDPKFKELYGRAASNIALDSYIRHLSDEKVKDPMGYEINEARFNIASLLLLYEANNPVDVPYVIDMDLPPAYFIKGQLYAPDSDRIIAPLGRS